MGSFALFLVLLATTMAPSPGEDAGTPFSADAPDSAATVFLPGLVSGPGQEYGLAVTEDWTEIYFTRDSTILMILRGDRDWSQPVVSPFSGTFIDAHPCLIPGGHRLVFVSRRPCPGARQVLNPWMVERTGDGWSAARSLGAPVTDQTVHAPSVSASGTLYATGLIRLRASGESYLPAEPLSPDIKGGNPAVAADESFVVYSARCQGGFGGNDLYVVFAEGEGCWGPPRNLGPGVNTEHVESSPSLSLDGRFLFFSRRGDIWWVSADVIERLRP